MEIIPSRTYEIFRNIIRMAHISEISAPQTVHLLKDFLRAQGIKARPNHQLVGINYITTDLADFSPHVTMPLALGLVYIKPDNTDTQDFYVFKFDSEEHECLNSDFELKKKYPKLHGGHKRKFSVTDFS